MNSIPKVPPLLDRGIFFFFNDTATTEIYTLSLHDALPISTLPAHCLPAGLVGAPTARATSSTSRSEEHTSELQSQSNLVCRLLLAKKKNDRVLQLRLLKIDPFPLDSDLDQRLADQVDVVKHLLVGVVEHLIRFFFFNDTATTEIYTLSLHDALPILPGIQDLSAPRRAPSLVTITRPSG